MHNIKRLLIVEDNPADVLFAREAIAEVGLAVDVRVAETADEALQLLLREEFDLVLLDLQLPGRSGIDLLMQIRGEPQLTRQLVIVLTSSSDPQDVDMAYLARANAVVRKPLGMQAMLQAMRDIGGFWGRLAQLPRSRRKLRRGPGPV
jgi:two-component system, chemotaxis family, response regulator Rcp1